MLPNLPTGPYRLEVSLAGFRTNITEQMLKDAPQFSDDAWEDRNWEVQWHKHYRAPLYWEMGTQ